MLVYRIRWYYTVLDKKKAAFQGCFFVKVVRTERLELSHLSAPEPKSGASTNFATSAGKAALYCNMLVWQDAV